VHVVYKIECVLVFRMCRLLYQLAVLMEERYKMWYSFFVSFLCFKERERKNEI